MKKAKGQKDRTGTSVCGGAPVPETCPEIVAAGHEARIGGRVDDAAHNVVVSERQQVFPLGRARVPAAQADGALVRQQHVILCVIEHALGAMHLTPAQTGTWVEQTTRRIPRCQQTRAEELLREQYIQS